jgi:DNA-binding MarR family transcriptional regulator
MARPAAQVTPARQGGVIVEVSRQVPSKAPGETPGESPRSGSDGAAAGACELEQALAKLNQQTALWQSFLAAHRLIVEQLADEMEREHQLPLEWFDVLVHLADLPGLRSRQKDLRDRLLLSESGVSRLLVRMEKAGVITRTTADDDRRGMEIAVTDAGRVALLAAIESHLDLVASLFTGRLTTTDRTVLNRALTRLLDTPKPDSDASQR